MLYPYLSLDGARAILVLLLAIAQPLMGYWPQLRRWRHTTPSRSARLQTAVVPIEWAFAIWSVIFTGCLGFAIWQLMPANLADPLLREIGWLAIAVFSLTVAWEYYVPKHDLRWPSVGLIVATLVGLLVILGRLQAAEPHDAITFWLVAAPFQLFAGWISAAVFVNVVHAEARRQRTGNNRQHRVHRGSGSARWSRGRHNRRRALRLGDCLGSLWHRRGQHRPPAEPCRRDLRRRRGAGRACGCGGPTHAFVINQ